jgi:hypothetical protein
MEEQTVRLMHAGLLLLHYLKLSHNRACVNRASSSASAGQWGSTAVANPLDTARGLPPCAVYHSVLIEAGNTRLGIADAVPYACRVPYQ